MLLWTLWNCKASYKAALAEIAELWRMKMQIFFIHPHIFHMCFFWRIRRLNKMWWKCYFAIKLIHGSTDDAINEIDDQ